MCTALQAMEATKKRLSIGAVITNMFRSVLALSPGVYIFLGLLPSEICETYSYLPFSVPAWSWTVGGYNHDMCSVAVIVWMLL